MPETIDDRTIINAALARIGAGKIGSLNEETPLCAQAKAVYYDRVDALLGGYEWTFARKTYALDLVDETPQNGWKYAHALPGDKLSMPVRVLSNPRQPKDPLRDFAIEGNNLYADRKPLWATVMVRVSPAIWLPMFRLAVTVIVAADLAVPITHDQNLADALHLEGEGTPQENGRGGLIGRAIGMDAASSARSSPLWRDPLTAAKYG